MAVYVAADGLPCRCHDTHWTSLRLCDCHRHRCDPRIFRYRACVAGTVALAPARQVMLKAGRPPTEAASPVR
jgi:hypothetical protein